MTLSHIVVVAVFVPSMILIIEWGCHKLKAKRDAIAVQAFRKWQYATSLAIVIVALALPEAAFGIWLSVLSILQAALVSLYTSANFSNSSPQ